MQKLIDFIYLSIYIWIMSGIQIIMLCRFQKNGVKDPITFKVLYQKKVKGKYILIVSGLYVYFGRLCGRISEFWKWKQVSPNKCNPNPQQGCLNSNTEPIFG